MTSWVYKLAKNEIIEHLQKQNVDTEGTFEDLRQRLVQLAKRQPELFTDTKKSNWVNGAVTENKDAMPGGNDSAATIEPGESIAKIMGQIRKWGCHFDGRDPHSFLERVEELSQVYGYPGEYLLRGLPEMLRGEALTWFRNGRENWHSWEEFRGDFEAEYIPRESQVRMRRQARGREQKEGEPFRSYANDLLKLMRRAGGWSAKEQLDLLYENMLPETKRFIRPDEVDSLGELRARVTEVEQIEQQIWERRQKKPENQNLQEKIPPAATTPYNKDECCWRRPPRKFCSQCGKDDVLTRECHPRPGNGQRAEYQKETRPSKTQ
ncbi:uncharacterized protein LOC116847992 [Odontomachus brunneus]|uniref:uncharacterized protein LOC116847992 n=1 Tax=Odontomachus brunneus TaxID=486640 RepID=UPI0013F225B8|nr:uncharacterized protein LOC116847992 [Odontomachus brunneus]